MLCDPGDGKLKNEYALVSYIPGPLGEFLDRLRQELVQGCTAQSHVTVLPPRELLLVEDAKQELCIRSQNIPPFFLKLGPVRLFAQTNVIFLEILTGREHLTALHEAFNQGPLYFSERYDYHPHVTLAQRYEPAIERQLLEHAQRRWMEFTGSRMFTVDTLLFVQNTDNNMWVDLLCCELSGVPEAAAAHRR